MGNISFSKNNEFFIYLREKLTNFNKTLVLYMNLLKTTISSTKSPELNQFANIK